MTPTALARLRELVQRWAKHARILKQSAEVHRMMSSVGLAQPAENEAHGIQQCVDELSALLTDLASAASLKTPMQPVIDELRRRMKEVIDEPDPLFKIGVMAMTAQSDPYASAAVYRQALIDICNLALNVQEKKS